MTDDAISGVTNALITCEGDIVTIKIDLTRRMGMTSGSEIEQRHGLKKPVKMRIAYQPNAHCIPNGHGGFRPEILTVNCWIMEPAPKDLVPEMIEKIMAALGKEVATFTVQDALGAISEALAGYPKRLIRIYERARDGY